MDKILDYINFKNDGEVKLKETKFVKVWTTENWKIRLKNDTVEIYKKQNPFNYGNNNRNRHPRFVMYDVKNIKYFM